jgi:hypothetical protein
MSVNHCCLNKSRCILHDDIEPPLDNFKICPRTLHLCPHIMQYLNNCVGIALSIGFRYAVYILIRLFTLLR